MVPMDPTDPVAEIMVRAREALAIWDRPCLLVWSKADPILGGAHRFFERLVPTAEPPTFVRGGHFLQDASGAEIAEHVVAFVERT